MFKLTTKVYQTFVKKTLASSMLAVLFSTQVHVPVAAASELLPTVTITTAQSAQTDKKNPFEGPWLDSEPKTISTNEEKVVKTMYMDITNYTSAVNECDDSPFLTADGSVTQDGIVATNALPFGTKFRIPSLYGDKVFTVRDRMNQRYFYRVDVWTKNKKDAIQFGIKRKIPIEIIEMGSGKKNWDQWKGKAAEMHRVGKYGPKPDEQWL